MTQDLTELTGSHSYFKEVYLMTQDLIDPYWVTR